MIEAVAGRRRPWQLFRAAAAAASVIVCNVYLPANPLLPFFLLQFFRFAVLVFSRTLSGLAGLACPASGVLTQ